MQLIHELPSWIVHPSIYGFIKSINHIELFKFGFSLKIWKKKIHKKSFI